jgi:hypothetical protein
MLMILRLIKKLITGRKGIEKALTNKFKAVPITKKNFNLIKSPEVRTVHAIDGGNTIIVDGGAWLIAKIKTAVISYNKTRKVSQEEKTYYTSIINKEDYEITINDEKGSEVKINLPGFKNIEIDEVPNKIMKILEWKACQELCKKQPGLFVLMDSSLEPDNKVEEEIIGEVSKTENVVVGFCKTSRMRTISGRSLLGFINTISDKGTSWYYHPLYEDEEKINTFIIKLNNNSKFCHKVQLFKKEKNINQVFKVLYYFASDSETLGYPYPLVKADKTARITHFDKQMEKNKFERELKKTELINDSLSQSYHSELDKRMYRK